MFDGIEVEFAEFSIQLISLASRELGGVCTIRENPLIFHSINFSSE
ncbi:hypothetical protein BFG60_1559 [Microcystis aeruginosa NIES-98]|nr:hypothetical protein BFG60_1559 [Microcystis aeruginosa NIES-98]